MLGAALPTSCMTHLGPCSTLSLAAKSELQGFGGAYPSPSESDGGQEQGGVGFMAEGPVVRPVLPSSPVAAWGAWR